MKRIAFILTIGFCFAFGQALKCYYCKIGVLGLCMTSETTCQSGEQCFSGVGKAAGFIDVKSKGCLALDLCNKTQEETVNVGSANGTLYKLTKTCCSTDLCNAAPALPGTTGLNLALAAVSALFAFSYLV